MLGPRELGYSKAFGTKIMFLLSYIRDLHEVTVFLQLFTPLFEQSSLIPNTSRKPHVLENSGLGCTVVTRPLFLRLSRFFVIFGVIQHYDRVI